MKQSRYISMLKQAGLSPAALTLIGGGVGGLAGFGWDKAQDWYYGNKSDRPWWLSPLILGLAGTTPGLAYGATRGGLTRDSQGESDVSFADRWLTDGPTLYSKSQNTQSNVKDKERRHNLNKKGEFTPYTNPSTGAFSGSYNDIPVDNFNRAIWQDVSLGGTAPRLALPVSNTLLATQNQYAQNGQKPSFITPGQVCNTLINAGIGNLTSTVIGGTLGALAGIRPQARQAIQNAGIWSGLMQGVGNSIINAGN